MQNGAIIFIFSSMFMHLKLPFLQRRIQTINGSNRLIEMNQRKSEGGVVNAVITLQIPLGGILG